MAHTINDQGEREDFPGRSIINIVHERVSQGWTYDYAREDGWPRYYVTSPAGQRLRVDIDHVA